MNTHGVADTMYEMQGLSKDLLPACIVSTTFPAVPAPPSLTLAAFATKGYVVDGPTLVYVDQEAHTVTVTGSDGNYWLALTQDTFTTYASYTRVAGTHYAWRANATEPASVDGVLVFCQLVVSGGAITTVTPLTKVTSPPMSKQNSNAVAITGGTALLTGTLQVDGNTGLGTAPTGQRLQVNGPATITGNCTLGGAVYLPQTLQVAQTMGLNAAPGSGARFVLNWLRNTGPGIQIHHQDTDGGNANALLFTNLAGTQVGSISTTSTATAYNTSSDARLKSNITPLTAALERVRALRPVQFLWKADDSPGVGFVADEVAQVVEGVVTGEADAVNEDGSIAPQQMDHSKLVPWLTAALKETLAQVEALTDRVKLLEEALA